MVAADGFEPCLLGMSQICYLCTTTAISKCALLFFSIIIIAEFSDKVKFSFDEIRKEATFITPSGGLVRSDFKCAPIIWLIKEPHGVESGS